MSVYVISGICTMIRFHKSMVKNRFMKLRIQKKRNKGMACAARGMSATCVCNMAVGRGCP